MRQLIHLEACMFPLKNNKIKRSKPFIVLPIRLSGHAECVSSAARGLAVGDFGCYKANVLIHKWDRRSWRIIPAWCYLWLLSLEFALVLVALSVDLRGISTPSGRR